MGIDTHYDIYTSIAGKMKSIFSTSSIDKCCFSAPSFSNGYMYIQTINDSENGGDNYLYKYDMKNGVIVQKWKLIIMVTIISLVMIMYIPYLFLILKMKINT